MANSPEFDRIRIAAKTIAENLRDIKNTPAGQELFKNLTIVYVEPTCFASTTEHTYCNLAVREFVESLIRTANSPAENPIEDIEKAIDDVTTTYSTDGD